MRTEKVTFSFGKNWQSFLREYYTPERLDEAAKSLRGLSGLEDFHGRTFLDIGSGSGLFSLAALKLGATKVVSFDLDPFSVACTEELKKQHGSPDHWEVHRGSILDTEWIKTLGKNDIVYSWGVLHHTGDMWSAIRNAAALVPSHGLFLIAIYNTVQKGFKSSYWWQVKRWYNWSPRPIKKLFEWVFISGFFLRPFIVSGDPRNVLRRIEYVKGYKTFRGMNFWSDVRDWLGGFPYQYATPDEIVAFCEKECGLKIEKIKPVPFNGYGCNEFSFSRE